MSETSINQYFEGKSNSDVGQLYNSKRIDRMGIVVDKVKKWEPEEITLEMYQISDKFSLDLIKMYKDRVRGHQQSDDEVIDFQNRQIPKYTYEMQLYLVHKYDQYLNIGQLFCDLFKDYPGLCNHLAQQYPREVSDVVVRNYDLWNGNMEDFLDEYDSDYEDGQQFPILGSEEEKEMKIRLKIQHKIRTKQVSKRVKLLNKKIRLYEMMICLLQFHHSERPGIDKEQLKGEVTYEQIQKTLENFALYSMQFPLYRLIARRW
jgi:hypothetical protein